MRKIKTHPNEFKRFHNLLVKTVSWKPWYFKLSKHDKNPLKGDMWKYPNGRMSPKRAYQWMSAGFNVGIVATNMDPLVIIDIDDILMTPDSKMQPTLSVKTRKRVGMHYFYVTSDARCKRNIPTDGFGEMRATWQYVVAPGSYVVTDEDLISEMPESEVKYAGYYTLFNKVKPTYIEYDNIPKIFHDVVEKEALNEKNRKTEIKDHVLSNSALYDLTVKDIFNIPDKKTRFPSMFHNSKTGKNTALEGDWIICWRHNVNHNHLSSLAVMSGVANCQEAGWGHSASGIGPSIVNFKDGETIYTLWKFAKESGLIPEDDPIPLVAYKYLEDECV